MSFFSTPQVPQAPATDGAGPGSNTSAPALAWIVFSFSVGLPLALAGLGLQRWRITHAMGFALAGGVLSWAALINSEPAPGLTDVQVVITVLGFVGACFALGLFKVLRIAGLAILGVLGGLSLGLRIVLLKPHLLAFGINWAIIIVCALAVGVVIIWRIRLSVLLASTLTGTFFLALAVDLLIHGTTATSIGLRLIFDRNKAHQVAIAQLSYDPQLTTQLIIGVSLALVPALCYIQHLIFPNIIDPRASITDVEWDPSAAVRYNFDESSAAAPEKRRLRSRNRDPGGGGDGGGGFVNGY